MLDFEIENCNVIVIAVIRRHRWMRHPAMSAIAAIKCHRGLSFFSSRSCILL